MYGVNIIISTSQVRNRVFFVGLNRWSIVAELTRGARFHPGTRAPEEPVLRSTGCAAVFSTGRLKGL